MDTGATLYTQYLQGDDAALERLVTMYADGLVRFAYCFVKDSAAAEDIAEDTFATLIVKRKRFSARASFKTYLYKIARNKCLDYLRFHRRFTPLDDLDNVLLSNNTPESELCASDRNETLYKLLQQLPLQYRYALTLAYIEGFTAEQTSAIMGKTAKQTYNLLARAKQSLKQLLIDEGINYEDL